MGGVSIPNCQTVLIVLPFSFWYGLQNSAHRLIKVPLVNIYVILFVFDAMSVFILINYEEINTYLLFIFPRLLLNRSDNTGLRIFLYMKYMNIGLDFKEFFTRPHSFNCPSVLHCL